ncbi:hypothetical protein [Bacillus paramycoides]|nr:hypothetical protein [Bacillus paramycoides]
MNETISFEETLEAFSAYLIEKGRKTFKTNYTFNKGINRKTS